MFQLLYFIYDDPQLLETLNSAQRKHGQLCQLTQHFLENTTTLALFLVPAYFATAACPSSVYLTCHACIVTRKAPLLLHST